MMGYHQIFISICVNYNRMINNGDIYCCVHKLAAPNRTNCRRQYGQQNHFIDLSVKNNLKV